MRLQVQCCCYNNTGNPWANPNSIAGCCCGAQTDCCPSPGGLAVCRGKGNYCFVVVVVSSMVAAFVVCVAALAWWTHRYLIPPARPILAPKPLSLVQAAVLALSRVKPQA